MMIRNFFVPFLVFVFIVSSCTSDKTNEDTFEVKVRLVEEPDRLNPMLSKSAISTQIENYIFLPLMEFDPVSLKMIPILVEDQPVVQKFRNGKSYTFTIKESAKWQDGIPITGEDYLFTVKSAINPHTDANAWAGFLSEIDSISIDQNDSRKFTVYIDNAFHLAKETAANFNIYPKHFYDSNGWLDDYTLDDLRKDSIGGNAQLFGDRFKTSTFSRDSILGSGPYKLVEWQVNLKLKLAKIENYALDHPQANPDFITYLVVPDEATALSMLKGGQVDIISSVNPTVFNDLQNDGKDQFNFETPSIFQYYYLALNNTNKKLKEVTVRKALAHVLDLNQMSKVLMAGLAAPICGPIHPSKPHYNRDLDVISFDLNKSNNLLDKAGWLDSNNDGVRDKVIDGKKVELSIDILVTQRELGRNLARIFKENAAKAGVNVTIISQEWGEIAKRMASRNFDVIAMARRPSPGLDDFYQAWHTASIGPDGRNISGFGTPESDSIIIAIRTETDVEKRNDLYLKMQEIIYENQPVIFLFAPTETIIHSNDINLTISSRRPGYFEGSTTRK